MQTGVQEKYRTKCSALAATILSFSGDLYIGWSEEEAITRLVRYNGSDSSPEFTSIGSATSGLNLNPIAVDSRSPFLCASGQEIFLSTIEQKIVANRRYGSSR
jgi:hypothetical protein